MLFPKTKAFFRNVAMLFPISTTFTIPYTGYYRLSALGAGASGGAIFTTTSGGAASGGGGGAFCESEVKLSAGAVLTIVIGAGGAQKTSSVSGTGYDGADGGATTIVCAAAGINISAGGGVKGLYTKGNTTNVAGGAGGVATGGNINASGGAGGAATHLTNGAEAGGGGASGSPFGTGGAGGYAISAGAAIISAGGGGAIGGYVGGNVTGNDQAGGGAGTGGSASGVTNGPNILGLASISSVDGMNRSTPNIASMSFYDNIGFDNIVDPFRALTGGGGGNGQYNTTAGPGAGSTGVTRVDGYFAGNPGFCGGSGGHAAAGGAKSGKPYFGGGSGGAASTVTGSAISQMGGNGLVVIERIG